MCLWFDQPSLQIPWVFMQNRFDAWEFMENVWKSCENVGKLGLKLVFLKNFASHTHAFYSYFSMIGGVYAQNWAVFQNCVFFFFRISIDWSYFSINRNCFKNFKWASICFDQSNIRFRSIENHMRSFLKTDFQLSQTLFQKKCLYLLENPRKKESVVLELARGRVNKFLLVGSSRILVV